ncbi:hypothetical protein AB7M17_003098 [Bradyrhizobium sp. USDA 377]
MQATHSYFCVGGASNPCLPAHAEQLSIIEQACCRHLDNMLWRLRPNTRDRFWFFLTDNPVPGASAYSEGKDKVGEVRLTTGLLAALIALSARAAIIIDRSGSFVPWMPTFARTGNLGGLNRPFDGLKPFALSEPKRRATGFSNQEFEEISRKVGEDPLLLVNTLKLACAAIEFAVLHELGHFDAGHDEAIRVQQGKVNPAKGYEHFSFRRDIRVQRVFEHQADIFALRLMIATATFRPNHYDDPDLIPEPSDQLRTEANISAYIGASLNFALAALLRANDPGPGEEIDLARSARGEHPPPITRLKIADAQVRLELADAKIGKQLWPNAPDMVEAILQGMTFHTMFLAMTTLSRSWQTAINTMNPESPTINLKFAFEDDSDIEDYFSSEDERIAKRTMMATGTQRKPPLMERFKILARLYAHIWGLKR